MSQPADPPPDAPNDARAPRPPAPQPIPEAWLKPPEPDVKWSPAQPPSRKDGVFTLVGKILAGIGILVAVSVLLFIGTCFYLVGKH